VSLEKRARLSRTYSQEKKIKSIHGKNDFVKKDYAQFGPRVNSHESYINWGIYLRSTKQKVLIAKLKFGKRTLFRVSFSSEVFNTTKVLLDVFAGTCLHQGIEQISDTI